MGAELDWAVEVRTADGWRYCKDANATAPDLLSFRCYQAWADLLGYEVGSWGVPRKIGLSRSHRPRDMDPASRQRFVCAEDYPSGMSLPVAVPMLADLEACNWPEEDSASSVVPWLQQYGSGQDVRLLLTVSY